MVGSFLVQVNRDLGYANIVNNRRYQNDAWMRKSRDTDHGQVKKGDELLVYCTRNVPNYGMSLAFRVVVKAVSEDHVTFDLDEPPGVLNSSQIGIYTYSGR